MVELLIGVVSCFIFDYGSVCGQTKHNPSSIPLAVHNYLHTIRLNCIVCTFNQDTLNKLKSKVFRGLGLLVFQYK